MRWEVKNKPLMDRRLRYDLDIVGNGIPQRAIMEKGGREQDGGLSFKV